MCTDYKRAKFRIEMLAFKINFRLQKVVKRKIHKYACLRIFSLTTNRKQKLIPKADLKRECPYLCSKKILKRVLVNIKKKKKLFPIAFSKRDLTA